MCEECENGKKKKKTEVERNIEELRRSYEKETVQTRFKI